MRGEVLKPEDASGPGLILGEDGRRYNYVAARVHRSAPLAAGAPVDFVPLGDEARDIYPLTGGRPVSQPVNTQTAYQPAIATKSEGLFLYFRRALTRNYFQFYGRARRAEYWGYVLFYVIALVVCFVLDALISSAVFGDFYQGEIGFVPILTVLFYVFSFIPGISITVRRLHDQDMSGWLYLLNIVPYIGGIILFILMFFDSRPQPNKHGASPKYGAAQTVDVFA
ncbi:MAG: DUF805 domain-containing protein [Hyphomonas sp.]|nr:DUF805 domain-containing protein [Hyphomonas sp.]